MPLISFDKILRILEVLVSVLKMAVQSFVPSEVRDEKDA